MFETIALWINTTTHMDLILDYDQIFFEEDFPRDLAIGYINRKTCGQVSINRR